MPDDPIIFALAGAAEALTGDDRTRADALMSQIAFQPVQIVRRQSVPVARMAAVFARDHFTCCYCGRRTVPAVVLRCFSALWPEVSLGIEAGAAT